MNDSRDVNDSLIMIGQLTKEKLNLISIINDQRIEINRLAQELEESRKGLEVLVWRDGFTDNDIGIGSTGPAKMLCAMLYEDCFCEIFGKDTLDLIDRAKRTMKVKMWSED